ncbi:MAG: SRPBCC domain-containing protein [Anaerolineae bacterium]|jgi:uncharacterized protein YndB with AHSA1/START domain|nr:SRPBCC domain-containing protein [Anaerolineae bacterium]
MNHFTVSHTDRVFTAVMVFKAPRTRVFEMWSRPEHLKHWWGPTGWSLPICELDFRVGGEWIYCMQSDEGQQSCGKGVYEQIRAPELIVYRDYFTDATGNINPEFPASLNTVEFADLGDGRTQVTSHSEYESAEQLRMVLDMGMTEGFRDTIARLEAYLAGV